MKPTLTESQSPAPTETVSPESRKIIDLAREWGRAHDALTEATRREEDARKAIYAEFDALAESPPNLSAGELLLAAFDDYDDDGGDMISPAEEAEWKRREALAGGPEGEGGREEERPDGSN